MQAGGVAEHGHRLTRHERHGDAGGGGRGLEGVDGVGRQFTEVEVGEGNAEAVTGTGVREEILGHPLELLGAAVDGAQHADLVLGELRRVIEQQLNEAPNGGDRRAQLVRDGGHHVVLHLRQLAQAAVMLDERLGHFPLHGEDALPLRRQFLPRNVKITLMVLFLFFASSSRSVTSMATTT